MIELPIRHEDHAYRDTWLWVPKGRVNVRMLKHSLTLPINGGRDEIVMYREAERHIGIPRARLDPDELDYEVVDLTPRSYEPVKIESRVVLDAQDPSSNQQAEAFYDLMQADGGILHVKCGLGKALAHGEPVLTDCGWVPIENIQVGNRVVGVDGLPHPVVGVFPQGVRDLYRVTFTDHTSVVCDANHLWTVELRRKRGRPRTTMTTKELRASGPRGSSGRKFYLPMPSPVAGSETDLPLDPYTLGALLGDGHLSVRGQVHFTTPDPELFDYMVLPKHTRPKALPEASQHAGKALTYRLSANRSNCQKRGVAKLADILQSLGLMGRTSHHKFVPPSYLHSTPENRLALLQGLLDTDGTVAGSGVEFSTASLSLAEDTQYLVCSLGGTAKLTPRRTWCGGKQFPSYRLYLKLPDDAPPFRLSRKQLALPKTRQRPPYRAIDRIEPAGSGPATCISVDSPDHLYLTRNCAPTHNTVLALHAIAEWGVPAVVIANPGHLKQWEGEIKLHLEVDGKLGWIQGKPSKWKWEGCPIILASLKTLSIYADQVPYDLCVYPGVVFWDEIQHLAANGYSKTSDMFPGRRYGLTATVNRPDGLEMQYLWHVGPVIHRNLTYDLIPKVTFVTSPTTIDWSEDRELYCDKFGEVHIQKLCAYVGQRPSEIAFARHIIDQEVTTGGNILALSVSRDHSRALHAFYPDSGVIDAGVPFNKRMDMLHGHELVFATVQIAREALNKKVLSVLILLTEFSSDNNLQQAIGRVLRKCAGKLPKVIILSHNNIGPMNAMGQKLRRHFRGWGMEVTNEQ